VTINIYIDTVEGQCGTVGNTSY